ncbi:hypothetical protein MKX01_026873 [Papaver californicum]|nr:hypothetical protein MKX01_026873 [Papaver californicum]
MRSNHHQQSYNGHHRFSTMASLPPLHGSLNSNNRSISSVQAHSAYPKPATSLVLPSFRSNSSHNNLYGQNDHRDEWVSSSSRLPIMDHQPAIGRLPSFVHGSVRGGGGSNQGDSKKIDLALKL